MTREEVKKEIIQDFRFPAKGTPLQMDLLSRFGEIGELLSQPQLCNGALQTLNDQLVLHTHRESWEVQNAYATAARINVDLWKKLKNNADLAKNTTWNTIRRAQVDEAFRKSLDSVLRENEIKGGFTPSVVILTILNQDQFHDRILKEQHPFKDPKVGPVHGEFTHRIQWYIIMNSNLPTGLFQQWADIYKEMALVRQPVPRKDGRLGVWDALVDRASFPDGMQSPFKTTSEMDFRSPENLNRYLISKDATFKELSSFLLARFAKRMAMGITNGNGVTDHLVRKIYGRDADFMSLKPEQRQFINEVMRDLVYWP